MSGIKSKRHKSDKDTKSDRAAYGTNAADMTGLSVFCVQKSGMSTVDMSTVNKIVYGNSQHSAHFKHSQQLAEKTTKRIDAMKYKLAQLQQQWKSQHDAYNIALHDTEIKLQQIESTRQLNRWFLHIDLDMFYAAAELIDRPDLHDKPVAVGGVGMITTANYVARKYGVRAAMPGFIALKLCKDLVFVKTDFVKYSAYASQCREIFAQYDNDYAAVSLDEAYLDITDYIKQNCDKYLSDEYERSIVPLPTYLPVLHVEAGKSSIWSADNNDSVAMQQLMNTDSTALVAYRIAAEIRTKIYMKTGLTASAGIGTNRMLSKVTSDYNKPSGQMLIPANKDIILHFMSQLSCRKVPGIGKVMERVLHEIVNAVKCSDVTQPANALIIYNLFTHDTATWILQHCLGISTNRHETAEDSKRKSISCERTFSEINTYEQMKAKCCDIAVSLSEDVYDHSVSAKCITLKLKNTEFHVFQRSVTLPTYIHNVKDITKYALQILKQEYEKLELLHKSNNLPATEPVLRLRLMGIRLSTLKNTTASNTLDSFVKHNINNNNTDIIHNDDSVLSLTNDDSVSSVKSDTIRQCPLCSRSFLPDATEHAINQHIDKCLTIPAGWSKNSSNAAKRSVPIHTKPIKSGTLNDYADKMYGIQTHKSDNVTINHVQTDNNVTIQQIIETKQNVSATNNVTTDSKYSLDAIDVDEFFSV